MDKVIGEVVIGALVLSLLFFIIPMYRQNSELIKNMAEKADYSEKIKEVMLPSLQKDSQCLGRDVISVIRYYELKGGARIRVIDNEAGLYVYEGEAYDPGRFEIDPDKTFSVELIKTTDALEIEFTS